MILTTVCYVSIAVPDCKSKWANLRSSYARVLRDSEASSGSRGGKKRKWYLMEAMEFLRDFTASHRPSISNEDSQATQATPEPTVVEQFEEEDTPSPSPSVIKKPKSLAQKVAEPMIEYLKSKTGVREDENPMLTFFRSSILQLDKLSDAKKRQFQMQFLSLVDKFVTESERENVMELEIDEN